MNVDMQLRAPAAAKRLGVCLSNFWKLAKNDPSFPPLTRIGRTTSVSAAALDAYVAGKTSDKGRANG